MKPLRELFGFSFLRTLDWSTHLISAISASLISACVPDVRQRRSGSRKDKRPRSTSSPCNSATSGRPRHRSSRRSAPRRRRRRLRPSVALTRSPRSFLPLPTRTPFLPWRASDPGPPTCPACPPCPGRWAQRSQWPTLPHKHTLTPTRTRKPKRAWRQRWRRPLRRPRLKTTCQPSFLRCHFSYANRYPMLTG